MNILDLYRSKGLDCKKVASTHGGEYCGACPGCGGDDRFRIWPEQNSGQGSFFCRGCRKAGDRVTFLMEFDGMNYPEACAALDIEIQDRAYRTPMAPGGAKKVRKSEGEKTGKSDLPPEVWVEKAGQLVAWAHGKLMENQEQLGWLAARGIDIEMVERFKLGWNPGKDGRDLWRLREAWGLATEMKENKAGKMVKKRLWIPKGLVVPLFSVQGSKVKRIRIRRPEGNPPRYYIIPGSNMDMMLIKDEHRTSNVQHRIVNKNKSRVILVVESELDAIMCNSQSGGMCSILAIGSSSAKPDENLMEVLRNAAAILAALDYDGAGQKAMKWWKDEFHQAKLWPVPEGGDPGEAFQAGVNIRAWISAGMPPAFAVGPSLLDNKKKGPPQKIQGNGKEERENNGDGVEELAELLRRHPVVIHNMSERTYIAASVKWQQQNWEVYKRISELVFLTPEVFRFVSGHPAGKISGKNIILS